MSKTAKGKRKAAGSLTGGKAAKGAKKNSSTTPPRPENNDDDANVGTGSSPLTSFKNPIHGSAACPRTILGSSGHRVRPDTDGLGCSYDCGGNSRKFLVVSKFFRNNQANFAMMKDLRKEAVDYCFLDDHNLSNTELVCLFGKVAYLTRDEIFSMHPNLNMSPAVVDCWSILLNTLEFGEKSVPSKLFMGVRHTGMIQSIYQEEYENSQDNDPRIDKLFAFWDKFLENNEGMCKLQSDLIFLPLYNENHYFCVCINFVMKRIEVLDQIPYNNWKQSDVCKLSEVVAGHFLDYMEARSIDKSKDIVNFSPLLIKLGWQDPDNMDVESGCFLMMHMACYEGIRFPSELGKKMCMRSFVVEMAASLLLADCNKYRQRFLESLQNFRAGKKHYGCNCK